MPTTWVDLFAAQIEKLIPLQYSATSCCWGGYVSIRGPIALVEAGTADIVN